LGPTLIAVTAVGPLWRMASPLLAGCFADSSMVPFCSLDYFGCGSLLGLALHSNQALAQRRFAVTGWLCFGTYAILYACWQGGQPIPYLASFQQTFLAVSFAVLAAFAHRGIRGWVGQFLSHPFLLRIGTYSYGLYLFHNLAPLLAGKIAPFLWHAALRDPLATVLRLPVWAALAWAMAWACHRWIEVPLVGKKL
jgi:peptidoglycan/LPS O-acetylase OafA/YrhL